MTLAEWKDANPMNMVKICAVPMKAQDAVDILIDEILGPDWCVNYSCNAEQANTEAVHAIVHEIKKLKTPWWKKIFS